jgi:signal transduction histidine kinase
MTDSPTSDDRISLFIEATNNLKQGNYKLDLAGLDDHDDLGKLGAALNDLAQTLELRYRELQKLDQITTLINAGLLLDEILENVYRDFREIIPYNRIGFSLITPDGQHIRARWAKTDQPEVHLYVGYEAALAGSSLEQIMATGRPRIINDLEDYLRRKPSSESTALIVKEGIRSSLTCPLIANGVPVGFMFFSSVDKEAYAAVHIRSFLRIAEQLSVIVEKGRLVSELAEQKAAIEEKNAELIRLNELKNQFLGIAAHDLRNPIAYIQMASEFMLDPVGEEPLSVNDTRMLTDIRDQSQHMLTLLNELLDVTQIESGKLTLKPESIDVTQFLQDAARRHAQLAAPKGTILHIGEVPAGLVMADRSRLRQVIDNLVSNAVKYAPAGTTVTIDAARMDDCWRISVTDEGPGIKPEDREKLFTDFAKLSAKPTGGESSTGLGLAITRRIVEAHGGYIDVDSTPGHGATFWFTLPA